MNIMTKRGQIDNVITYEHICDTRADMNNIPATQITLGSICIVLSGNNGALEVYMADSNKEWKSIMETSWGGDQATGSSSVIGPMYDENNTYSKNAICIHDGKLYTANTTGVTGEWDESKWTETTIAALLAQRPTDRVANSTIAPYATSDSKIGDIIMSTSGTIGYIYDQETIPSGGSQAGGDVANMLQSTTVIDEIKVAQNLNPLGNILSPFQKGYDVIDFYQAGIKVKVNRNSFSTIYDGTTTPASQNIQVSLTGTGNLDRSSDFTNPSTNGWLPTVYPSDLITKPGIITTDTLPNLYFWVYCPTDNLYIATNLILASCASDDTITYSKISPPYANHNMGFYTVPLSSLSVASDIISNNNMAVYFYLWHETLTSSHDPVYWGIGYSPVPLNGGD